MGKKKAAILARVSTDLQDTQSQINSLNAFAEKMGYTIPNEYVFKENITGMDNSNKEDRKSLGDLKIAIERKKDIEFVLMWELTRLSRNPYFLIEQLDWFNNQKIPIYFYDIDKWTRDINTNKEIADTTTYIFGAATYGKAELEKIKARTMRGRDEKAKKGLFVGHISDGYKVEIINKEKHIVIDDERKSIIKQIFDLYTDKHMSTNRIARELNNDRVLTFNAYEANLNLSNPKFDQRYKIRNTNYIKEKSKQKWTGSSIGQLLKNEWYIGKRLYKGDEYSIPAIISKEQFNIAKENLKTNNKTIPNRRYITYLLKGKFFCGKCGKIMNGHKVRINSSYYCSSLETGQKCGEEGICKQNIEAIIWDIVLVKVWTNHNDINLNDIFKIPDGDIKEYRRKVNKNNDKISRNKKNIKNYQKQLSELFNEKTMYDSTYVKESIEISIKTVTKNIEENVLEIDDLEKENNDIHKRLENNDNIDNIVFNILNDDNISMERIKEIIDKIINRVTLYNLGSYDKLIIVEFFSLKKTAVIYNSKTLKGRYINLEVLYNDDHISFDKDSRKFVNNHSCIVTYSDTPDVKVFDSKNEDLLRDVMNASNKFSFETLSRLIDSDAIKEMLSFFTNTYIRIEEEPKDEEFKKWREDYKRWSKIRSEKRKENRLSRKHKKLDNPKQVAEIRNQRKNLYNQRYKAKKSKVLSEEDKIKKLRQIEENINTLNLKLKG